VFHPWLRSLLSALCLAVATCVAVGCRGRESAVSSTPVEKPAGVVQSEITLRTVDAAGLAQAVQQYPGKVVLIDYWATWCEPCLKLFPHAIDLEQRFRDKGLAVITVSLDDHGSAAAVRRFLRQQLAGKEAEAMQNLLSSYGVGSEAFTAFDIADGALPHVKLYGRDGRLLRTFVSGGDAIAPRKIEAAVEEALKPL
jgi:thiol-disulfide isomerase/thioredoxin